MKLAFEKYIFLNEVQFDQRILPNHCLAQLN